MKHLSVIIFLFSFYFSYAQEDTTFIIGHDYVDMDAHGNFDHWAVFPNEDDSYRKILMHYDLRCASSEADWPGCSGWDYTTKISILKENGEFDESGNPIFVHGQTLANVVTPYGTYMMDSGTQGFSPQWVHRYTYDLTDFAPLLKDSVLIRAFYGGWPQPETPQAPNADGAFNVTLNFELIEGIPPRNVIDIKNLWSGNKNYSDLQNLNDSVVFISNDVQNSMLRVTVSGHGQNGEFTDNVNYYIDINSENVSTNEIWREDCGENSIYPQGGTWIYDRANWCPGDKATTREHEISTFVQSGQNNLFSFDIFKPANVSWEYPGGESSASYIYDVQLFTFEEPNFNLDAVIEEIISPSNKKEYSRYNPSCSSPVIKIKNQGSQILNSAEIHYGFDEFSNNIFYWSGNLKFGETEIIELPPISWNWENQTPFFANIITANNIEDEYEVNNMLKSNYEYVEEYPSSFAMWFKTNSYPNESSYEIRNNENELIFSKTGMEANTLYKDTFNLSPGCYKIQILDTGGNQNLNEDGLSWWANDDGSGYARLREVPGGFFKYYQADFGTELTDYFRVGNYFMSNTEIEDILFDVFPNPSNGNFNVFVESNINNKVILKIIDINGKVIKEMIKDEESSYQNFSIKNLPNGIYTILLESENDRMKKNIVIAK